MENQNKGLFSIRNELIIFVYSAASFLIIITLLFMFILFLNQKPSDIQSLKQPVTLYGKHITNDWYSIPVIIVKDGDGKLHNIDAFYVRALDRINIGDTIK